MADAFANYRPGLDSPASNFTVIASTGTVLANSCRALIAWTTGTIGLVSVGGSTGTCTVHAAPYQIPIRCSAITAATATVWALHD